MYFSLMPLRSLRTLNAFKCFAVSAPNQGRNQIYGNIPPCDDRKLQRQFCIPFTTQPYLETTFALANQADVILCLTNSSNSKALLSQKHSWYADGWTLRAFSNLNDSMILSSVSIPDRIYYNFFTCIPRIGAKIYHAINKRTLRNLK